MAVELATAYISLVPSARGIKEAVGKEMKGVESLVAQSTDRASKALVGKLGAGGAQAAKAFGVRMDEIGTKVAKVGTKMSLFVSVPIALALKKATSLASDLNETLSKSDVIFEGNSQAMQQWSKGSAKAFGVSRQEALEAATTFGGLFKQVGLGIPVSAEFSKNLVQMSADLGSINNADPSQVLDDFRSGLAGQSEPLRKYNIFLSESAVATKAVELGLGDAHRELTEGEKVQARYALIVEQASYAQGDFARTADGLANSQRIAAAEAKDAAAEFGQRLLPIAAQLLSVGMGLLGVFQGLPGPMQQAILYGGLLAVALGPLLSVSGNVVKAVGGVSKAVGSLVETLTKRKAADAVASFVNGMNGASTSTQSFGQKLGKVAPMVGLVTSAVVLGGLAYNSYASTKAEAVAITDAFLAALAQEREGLAGATDAAILKQLADAGVLRTLQEYGAATEDVVKTVKGDTAARARLVEQTKGQTAINPVLAFSMDALADRFDDATAKDESLTAAHDDLTGASKDAAAAQGEVTSATKLATAAIKLTTAAVDEAVQALNEQWAATNRGRDALFDFISAVQSDQAAERELAVVREEVRVHTEAGTLTTDEGRDATDRYTAAQQDAVLKDQERVQSLLKMAEEMRVSGEPIDAIAQKLREQGAAAGLSDVEIAGLIAQLYAMPSAANEAAKTQSFEEAVARVAGSLRDTLTPQLRDAIAAYYGLRDAVNSVPERNFSLGGGMPARAEGGPVEAGRAYLVGEKRAEMFVPGASGWIYPEVPQLAKGSRASGGVVEVHLHLAEDIDKVVRVSLADVFDRAEGDDLYAETP